MIPKFRHKKQFLGHNGAVFCLASDNDQGFYSCGSDGMLVHWPSPELSDGELFARINNSVYALMFHKEKDVFLTGDMNGNLQWISEGEERFNFKAHKKGIFAIQDLGDRFITLGGDGQLGVWEWDNPKSPFFIPLSDTSLRAVCVLKTKRLVCIGSSDGNIYILDMDTLESIYSIAEAHSSSVFSLCMLEASNTLFSGGRDNFIKCWDMNDFSLNHVVPAHAATVNHIIEGPSGTLISAGRDKEVRIWDSNVMRLNQVLKAPRDKGHVNSVNRLLWQNDTGLLYSTGDDKTIICWEME